MNEEEYIDEWPYDEDADWDFSDEEWVDDWDEIDDIDDYHYVDKEE